MTATTTTTTSASKKSKVASSHQKKKKSIVFKEKKGTTKSTTTTTGNNGNMDIDNEDDDDDEEDESYRGSSEDESEGADKEASDTEHGIQEISIKRRRLMNEAWKEMNRVDWEDTVTRMSKALPQRHDHFLDYQQSRDQLQLLLVSIFGERKRKHRNVEQQQQQQQQGKVEDNGERLREQIQQAVKKVIRKDVVEETVKFAGQEMKIQKTSDTLTTKKATENATPASSLDNVLETLKGPKTISTISKSSMDWDNFKEQEGLQDALATAAEDGYLNRQEFLNRCDVRKFETERDERLLKQAQQSSSDGGRH